MPFNRFPHEFLPLLQEVIVRNPPRVGHFKQLHIHPAGDVLWTIDRRGTSDKKKHELCLLYNI